MIPDIIITTKTGKVYSVTPWSSLTLGSSLYRSGEISEQYLQKLIVTAWERLGTGGRCTDTEPSPQNSR